MLEFNSSHPVFPYSERPDCRAGGHLLAVEDHGRSAARESLSTFHHDDVNSRLEGD